MSRLPALSPGAAEAPTPTGDLRLQGHRRAIARTAWTIAAVLSLAVTASSIPIDLRLLQTVCTTASCIDSEQLTAVGAHSLQQLGISVGTYAVLSLGLTLLTTCAWFGVALVLVWRRSDEWMTLLAALMLVYQGSNNLVNPVQQVSGFWQFPAQVQGYLAFVLVFLTLLLFPDGRFRPRWTPWLFAIWVVTLWLGNFGPLPQALLPFFLLLWAGLLLSLLIIQVYRYRRVSTPVQRQQTKWVVLGVGTVLIFEAVASILQTPLFPSISAQGTLSALLLAYGTFVIPVLIPLSIGLAILRFRLWDVDVLINRALVYGLLTGVLVALYAGLIIGLESLIGIVAGTANKPIALVLSTLVIAALFQPLRTRVQSVIDRRFFRTKYDAARALEAFSSALRQEIDLEQLQAQLLSVVVETMQPAQVSMWLRDAPRHPQGSSLPPNSVL